MQLRQKVFTSMDPTLLHKVEHLRSPPQAHSSPGTTPGTISLAHGTMLPALNLNSSLMNKIHKTTSYSSPPPVANNPDNNVCKLIDYRGAKIAAFVVEGRELICLPQAFELFLKHLVGGLHTVYTKLKRLDITPVVCNVEQVRILRGLGAIQPGVNRCKLISCKEFDVLYEDCTNSRYVNYSLFKTFTLFQTFFTLVLFKSIIVFFALKMQSLVHLKKICYFPFQRDCNR